MTSAVPSIWTHGPFQSSDSTIRLTRGSRLALRVLARSGYVEDHDPARSRRRRRSAARPAGSRRPGGSSGSRGAGGGRSRAARRRATRVFVAMEGLMHARVRRGVRSNAAPSHKGPVRYRSPEASCTARSVPAAGRAPGAGSAGGRRGRGTTPAAAARPRRRSRRRRGRGGRTVPPGGPWRSGAGRPSRPRRAAAAVRRARAAPAAYASYACGLVNHGDGSSPKSSARLART